MWGGRVKCENIRLIALPPPSSIENFKRDKEEVESLFDLFREKIRLLIAEEKKLAEQGVRVKILGKIEFWPNIYCDVIGEV